MGGDSCRFWKKIKVSLIHAAYYGEDTSFCIDVCFISFYENEIQKLTDDSIKKIEEMLSQKEKDILQV